MGNLAICENDHNLKHRKGGIMKPYLCPVCKGTGNVQGGFYQSTPGHSVWCNTLETCRSCGGTGIVWGYEESPPYEGPLGVSNEYPKQ